jgi:hypothetical protein
MRVERQGKQYPLTPGLISMVNARIDRLRQVQPGPVRAGTKGEALAPTSGEAGSGTGVNAGLAV